MYNAKNVKFNFLAMEDSIYFWKKGSASVYFSKCIDIKYSIKYR